MKIFKFLAAVLALVAMTFSFSSCSRELNPDDPNEGKGWYRCEVAVDNAGSLSDEQKTLLSNTIDETMGLDANATHPFTYCHQDYMETNYNKIVALSASESDIIQKIIIPVAKSTGVKDFSVKFVLQKRNGTADDSEVTDLKSVSYTAANYVQQ